MKIMQQHYHSTIYCKVKGITEKSGLCECDNNYVHDCANQQIQAQNNLVVDGK